MGKVKARRTRPRADIVDTGGCGWLLEIVAESDEKLVLLRSLISAFHQPQTETRIFLKSVEQWLFLKLMCVEESKDEECDQEEGQEGRVRGSPQPLQV